MTVLAISSQVVAGHVGNSAAQFVLETLGHDVWGIPTVLLSHHPGHGTPAGRSTPAPEMENLLSSLWEGGWMDQVTAVMTGYFTSPDQIATAASTITRLKRMKDSLPVLVDPILGDNGTIYVADGVPDAISRQLIPLATITTPNLFELSVLTGRSWPLPSDTDIAALARGLALPEALVTSAPGASAITITTQLVSESSIDVFETERVSAPPNGVGDVAAAAYLGLRLNGEDSRQAAAASTEIVRELIAASAAGGLKELPLIAKRDVIISIAGES